MDLKQIKEKDVKQFGIALGIVLGLIGLLQWHHEHYTAMKILFAIGVVSEILAFTFPMALKPLCIQFLKLAKILAWINTRIILILVFYLMLIPIGFLAKIFGKDILDQKYDKKADTYWKERDMEYTKDHYLRQY